MDDIEAREKKVGDWVAVDVPLERFTIGRRYQVKQIYKSELSETLRFVTFGLANDHGQEQYVMPSYVSACGSPK